jgi:outer membrane receptor for Fe3+-dicitrate
MFKLAQKREVLWPVTVTVPVDGGVEKVEIQVRYRLLVRSELAAFTDRIKATAENGANVIDALDGLLTERITGWHGISDESGEDLPFTQDNLAAVLDVPYLREAIEAGLYAASRGALAKN